MLTGSKLSGWNVVCIFSMYIYLQKTVDGRYPANQLKGRISHNSHGFIYNTLYISGG